MSCGGTATDFDTSMVYDGLRVQEEAAFSAGVL
jgi:hypothetical protein